MRYRSSAALLGIPVIDVVVRSGAHDGAERVAKGWIAIGDVAFGILFAAGGIAIGGLSVGGVSIGGLAIAGLSVGLWSVGGLALGAVAFGGAAIAVSAAAGGLAVAGGHAVGGLAIAAHANDDVARTYFQTGGFLGLTYIATRFGDWIIAVLAGVIALVWVFREEKQR